MLHSSKCPAALSVVTAETTPVAERAVVAESAVAALSAVIGETAWPTATRSSVTSGTRGCGFRFCCGVRCHCVVIFHGCGDIVS